MAVKSKELPRELDWAKGEGLLPAIVQHADTGVVLMQGYMNCAALEQTLAQGRVVFFSRSKARLWMKGETSGNVLEVVAVSGDCDKDSILVQAIPHGPTCHTGRESCFADALRTGSNDFAFVSELEKVIDERRHATTEASYTAKLLSQGPQRIAQKIGEEGVEVALAAVGDDPSKIVSESADLMFHLLVLLRSRGLAFQDVVKELAARHRGSATRENSG